MSKKMLINATLDEENRVAIVDDGILCELDIEVAGHEQTKGNIYKAVVVRVEPGLQAAFIDYGAERLGFLQIDEINFKTVKPDFAKTEKNRGRPKISDLLSRGQELLVQIIREERGTKGAALTTYLSLAGRYMVLMPDNNTRGVSRRAENDKQRKQLKQVMTALELPDSFGYIVRTAALDQTKEELERDYRYLMRLYENIYELQNKAKAPTLIYRESNLVIRSIRDYFSAEMDEVLIDDPDMFREAKEFFSVVMPDSVGLVKLHQERRPIFSRFQIEDQIETINSNKVALPSGGSIVIDSTEALVAIDVNSGKMASEQGVEETATKTNLEAAVEIGRQLRLRDLGGLIVIDFIDMRDRKNIQLVEKQLKTSTGLDKARINIGRISQFGLLEMSRQRIKAALSESGYLSCPHCHGSGRIKSPETLAAKLLRRIHTSVAKGQIRRVNTELPLEVASYLLNNKREDLLELERRYNVDIHIHGNPALLTDQVEIDFLRRDKDKEAKQAFAATDILRSLAEERMHEEKPNSLIEVSDDTPEEEHPPAKKRRRRRPHQKVSEAQGATDSQLSNMSVSTQAQQPKAIVPPDKAGEPTGPRKEFLLNKTEEQHTLQNDNKNVATTAHEPGLNGTADESSLPETSAQLDNETAKVNVKIKKPTRRRRSTKTKTSNAKDDLSSKRSDDTSMDTHDSSSTLTPQAAESETTEAQITHKPEKAENGKSQQKSVQDEESSQSRVAGKEDSSAVPAKKQAARPGRPRKRPQNSSPKTESANSPNLNSKTPAAKKSEKTDETKKKAQPRKRRVKNPARKQTTTPENASQPHETDNSQGDSNAMAEKDNPQRDTLPETSP